MNMELDLPPMSQIGFVVSNVERAIEQHEPMFGPFEVIVSHIEAANFRGTDRDCSVKLGLGKSGDIEIELIELLDGESPHREFLAQGRTGMHHVRFDVENLDERVEQARGIGFQPIWYKQYSEDVKFCYLEREGDSLVIEFLQAPR